jgi:hypothetical protein
MSVFLTEALIRPEPTWAQPKSLHSNQQLKIKARARRTELDQAATGDLRSISQDNIVAQYFATILGTNSAWTARKSPELPKH